MKKRIYLYKSGTLHRQENSLLFISGEEKTYIPIYQIEDINVFNHCNLNKNTLLLLSKSKVNLNIFDYYGNYVGTFSGKPKQLGIDIINQVKFINDEERKIALAKEMISTSIVNMTSVLKYYNKKIDLNEKIIEISSYIKKLEAVDNIKSIMILEACSKQVYYSCFNSISYRNKIFTFTSRSTRPPKDPINAIMSFSYSMLYSIISNVIYRSRLNINLPVIHGVVRSDEGLQYDIADIFKPIICDRLIFRMINKNMIDQTCFENNDRLKGIYLNKKGMTIFIKNFEEMLADTIVVSGKRKMSYRNILSREVYKISEYILKGKTYKGYRHKW